MSESNLRDAILMVVTGQKRVGKTYATLKLIQEYLQNHTEGYVTINEKKIAVGRNVLIYDVNMEYTQYKTIPLKDVKKYSLQKKAEIRRVVPRLSDGSMADLDQTVDIMKEILKSYVGGLLILEDINKYLVDTTRQKEIIGIIATNRHRDLDIIVHLQSLAAVTPRMFQNTTAYRIHKQQESIDSYKDRLISFYEIFKITEILVNNQYFKGNKRFCAFVSAEDCYIKGEFSKLSLLDACKEYVEQYASLREIRKYESNYKKEVNSRDLAINAIATKIMQKYYK